MDSHVSSKLQRESWTNEKHVRFLNYMETSFVLTMLADNGRLLPLDRHLPDSSESTLDLKAMRIRKTTASAADFSGTTTTVNARPDKRSRRSVSFQPYDSSSQDDQVVPHFESRSDKDEKRPSK